MPWTLRTWRSIGVDNFREGLIKNSIITNNYASEGGGIFSVNHILEIENTIIEENGMDLYGSGGGIQLLLGE